MKAPLPIRVGPSRFPDAPPNIAALPVDARGFPIPWFVHVDDAGHEDFRVIGRGKMQRALQQRLCWICGQRLHTVKAFVIGPMCAINRISAEPPSHLECATFAARICPFLSRPLAKRNDRDLPVESCTNESALAHNPGVALVWCTARFKPVMGAGLDERLFQLGAPHSVRWYCEGRTATRDEVMTAIRKGLPFLVEAAAADGPEAITELQRRARDAMKFLPKAA
jgi:hypothetical protein